MTDRYFAKVVSVIDEYNVVINAGADKGAKLGLKFQIVGLGDLIKDPDTGEELERLEIIRGQAEIVHVQEKMATLKSCEFTHKLGTKEIKTIQSRDNSGIAALIGRSDVVTESIKPGESTLKPFRKVAVGDRAIRI